MNLLEITANRPTDEKRDEKPACPFCNSSSVSKGSTESTLAGYFGEDYNHTWTQCDCLSCGENFVRETKGPNCVWYTQNSRVLKGSPGCFETYEYQCAKCGGPVRRKYTNLEGGETHGLSSINVDGKMVKQYKTFFFCNNCGHGGEVDHDYLTEKKAGKE